MNSIDFVLPNVPTALGGPQATLISWLCPPGCELIHGMPLLIIATHKAEIVLPAPIAGILTETLKSAGQQLGPGSVIARISSSQAEHVPEQPASRPERPVQRATALARSIAAQAHIQLEKLSGSGDHGRITARDVRASMGMISRRSTAVIQAIPAPNAAQPYAGSLPICSAWMLCDASALQQLGKKAYRGLPISPLACLAAACSTALRRYPQAASFWSEEGLLLHNRPAMQIVDAEKTSLLEHVDDLNLYGIVRRMHHAETRSALPYTFSICSSTASLSHRPSLAPALILGPIQTRPVLVDDHGTQRVLMRPCAWLSFSYDARVLSFYQADRFLSVVIQLLER